ncbi:hypothetical protein MIDIC_500014 [Alphaproteobacteria bacterium]
MKMDNEKLLYCTTLILGIAIIFYYIGTQVRCYKILIPMPI